MKSGSDLNLKIFSNACLNFAFAFSARRVNLRLQLDCQLCQNSIGRFASCHFFARTTIQTPLNLMTRVIQSYLGTASRLFIWPMNDLMGVCNKKTETLRPQFLSNKSHLQGHEHGGTRIAALFLERYDNEPSSSEEIMCLDVLKVVSWSRARTWDRQRCRKLVLRDHFRKVAISIQQQQME